VKYLIPNGGEVNDVFGLLITPGSYGIPWGVRNGLLWAADNGAFIRDFDPDRFFPWLECFRPYFSTCLFVTCPDKVGDASKTIELFIQWRDQLGNWPVAFVAQDGQEDRLLPPPSMYDALFVGGSTEWKMSSNAIDCIHRARLYDKHIHIGRVNYFRRYQHFSSLPDSEKFTCDGTRTKYERTKAIKDWKNYMVRPKQYSLFVFGRNRIG
jgi:hypothetical protein